MKVSWNVLGAIAAVTVVALAIAIFAVVTHSNQRIDAVQQSRYEACLDVNERHDASVRQLDQILSQVPAAQRQQAQRSRQPTILLINAMVPKRNCKELIK